MDNLVSTDLILEWLKKAVQERRPIDPHTWVEASLKMNVLISDEHAKLYDLQQEVAKLKMLRIESGDSVARAKVYVETTEEYKNMKKQEAKIEQIQENIRISKLQARLSQDEIKNY